MRANAKDLGAAGVFLALGGWFAYQSLQLPLGSALRMGPGFFPLLLATLLIALGLILAVTALGVSGEAFRFAGPRAILLILVPPIIFGLTIRGLGFIPSVAIVVFLTSFASRRMSLWLAVALTVGITAFCYLVFLRGLGLPIRPVGPWLSF